MRLEGKIAVITGAAGGIGSEAARLFAEEGATVAVADLERARERGEEVARGCGGRFYPLDVADEGSVRAALDAVAADLGGIDVLYNNAGIMPPEDDSIRSTSLETWNRVFAVNAAGVFLCCKHAIPHLLARGGGSVINVSSLVALMGAATSQIAYTASKGAVLSLTRELAVEFARSGIRFNALCPGPVETSLVLRLFEEDPAAFERRRVHLPMGRLARADEIARAALYLASDESSYVNGSTFVVDGATTVAYVTPEG